MATCARYEPTIDEIMADPVVKALMKADRVDADRLELKLKNLRRLMLRIDQEIDDEKDRALLARPVPRSDAAARQLWG